MPHASRYIGITGVTSRGQAQAILDAMPSCTSRQLMIGVLASNKTLAGYPHQQWPDRYPPPEELVNIFPDSPRALNLLKYETDEVETVFDQLIELSERCGKFLHGFQLNIPWPDPYMLKAYRGLHPEKRFILQITGSMCTEMHNDRKAIANRIQCEYDWLAEHIMIDFSYKPRGLFNSTVIRDYIEAFKEAGLAMGIGVSGDVYTIGLVRYIAENHPDINTDTGDCLFTKDGRFSVNDAIELVQKQAYIFSNGGYV